MRAVIFERSGEPGEVLVPREVDPPRPGPNEVRVRMLASPVNPSDLMWIRGTYGHVPKLPATPGFEGCGIAEESGGGLLGRWLRGKRVALMSGTGGCWAEQAIVPAKQCVPLPAEVSTAQAAMFLINPLTAYIMTRKVLAVPKGAWLAQSAAASSLGRMVIRLGRHFEFKTLNIVRRPEQAEELTALGADAVVVFDPDRNDPADLVAQIREQTGEAGARFAIDPVGGPTGSAMIRALAPGGRMVVFGSLSSGETAFDPREILSRTITIEGFWLGSWLASVSMLERIRIVRAITRHAPSGILASEVGRSYSIEQVVEAVRESETPGRGGKAWLRME